MRGWRTSSMRLAGGKRQENNQNRYSGDFSGKESINFEKQGGYRNSQASDSKIIEFPSEKYKICSERCLEKFKGISNDKFTGQPVICCKRDTKIITRNTDSNRIPPTCSKTDETLFNNGHKVNQISNLKKTPHCRSHESVCNIKLVQDSHTICQKNNHPVTCANKTSRLRPFTKELCQHLSSSDLRRHDVSHHSKGDRLDNHHHHSHQSGTKPNSSHLGTLGLTPNQMIRQERCQKDTVISPQVPSTWVHYLSDKYSEQNGDCLKNGRNTNCSVSEAEISSTGTNKGMDHCQPQNLNNVRIRNRQKTPRNVSSRPISEVN